MSTNRIKIDAPTGLIEVEGEKEFVEAQLDKLMPLIESCGFGQYVDPQEAVRPETQANTGKDVPSGDAESNGTKKVKRAVNRPPKGHSCADRMLVLRGEGYFKEQRKPVDIVQALAKKGWTHKSNQVSAAAGKMFERGDIQRTAVDNGFAYFWDRD